jgi:Ca-activated chloride channel family protein
MRRGACQAVVVAAAALWACSPGAEPGTPAGHPDAAPAAVAVEVVLHYGSEKAGWVEEEMARFNATPATTRSGRFIKVVGRAMGSEEEARAISLGQARPTVFWPASSVNLRGVAAAGPSLARSPLVIAMWRPMAENLGWPGRALGWRDIVEVTTDPDGWGGRGHPAWGRFKLGHTHPRYASSGLLALLAEAHAGADKTSALSQADLDAPATRAFMTEIEESVVHYGRSTGFFAEQMGARGPGYLSAAVLYENLVIERRGMEAADGDLVAIQPVEGTLWADHPYTILNGAWVDADERAGAEAFLAFLQSPAAQGRARQYGFRPPAGELTPGAPFDLAHGVIADAVVPALPLPDEAMVAKLLEVWSRVKKASTIILVLDKSGSMDGRPLREAKAGARAFLSALEPRDQCAVSFFDQEVFPMVGPLLVRDGREELDGRIAGAVASGGTALYDAIAAAHAELAERARRAPHRIYAVVVLSDGQDTDSEVTLAELRDRLSHAGRAEPDDERADDEGVVRIFTIGYGTQARRDVLRGIAAETGGLHAEGNVDTIVDVYRETATLF